MEQLINTCAKGRLPDHLERHKWPKGVSGNPKGRPKGRSFLEYANEFLDAGIELDDGETVGMAELAQAVIKQAIGGHNIALKELLARIEPAPNHNININNNVSTTSKEMFEFMQKHKANTARLEEDEILQLQGGSDDTPDEDS